LSDAYSVAADPAGHGPRARPARARGARRRRRRHRLRRPGAVAAARASSACHRDGCDVIGNGRGLATAARARARVDRHDRAAAGLIVPGADIIVDAKSGVSGAGKTPSERTHFSECHGSVSAYGVFNHRHGAEIEQGIGAPVTFVPHLVPLDRGILSTIYVRLKAEATEEALAKIYEGAYAEAPFVRLVGASLPEIKHVAHTNFCDVGWRVDSAGRGVLVSVIDNLVKGAAGQAVQNLNVMLGV